MTQDFAGEPEAAGAEALRIATRAAERAGASVRALALPEIIAEAWRIHPIVQEFEAHQAFAWEYRENYDAMPPLLRGRLDESKGGTPADYDAARGVADRARAALAAIFDDVDVLLTFSAPGAAPKGLASTGDPRFNRLWTLMGVPCVNVPAYVADGGLPVGVQVIARFGDDAGALRAARFVEEALARVENLSSFRDAPSGADPDLESLREISGFDASHRPGMTTLQGVTSPRSAPRCPPATA